MIRYLLSFLLVLAIFLVGPVFAAQVTVNPYAGVDWEKVTQHKANFHTHTTQSDGRQTPAEVIHDYRKQGYTILALTDHNKITFPWQKFGCDPEETGMLAIEGIEFSAHHHMGSYFTDYDKKNRDENVSLADTAALNGLTMLNHPGRYNRPTEWYCDLYRKYDHLVGLEVYNQGDRYPHDREKWDEILTELMPERPVWGFANNDSHSAGHIGLNWNVLLLEELNEKNVREAMTRGSFYFTNISRVRKAAQPDTELPPAPTISSISVSDDSTTITIAANDADRIEWISAGKKVAEGAVIDLTATKDLGRYVRAEIVGDGGFTYTNPFGLEQ